jgi:hypothetical protein
MKIVIVTGCTADPAVLRCIQSVDASLDPGCEVEHWIVVDGQQYEQAATTLLATQESARPSWLTRRIVQLPHNTGKDGGQYLCHRVIAACAYLVPSGWWMSVLDQDNEVYPHHLASVATCIRKAPDTMRWGWTLRGVIDQSSTVQCLDTVESMGSVRCTCLGAPDRLIDTNCYVFRADLIRELAPLFGTTPARAEGVMEADRRVAHTLLAHEPTSFCTRDWTVKYRVDGRGDSVTLDFFRRGVRGMRPWSPAKRDLYVFHFDKARTDAVLRRQQHFPLDEWCLTMYDAMDDTYNLIHGFDSIAGLPHDAVVLLTMCHPDGLPLAELAQLKRTTHPGMTRVLYTAEGPNKRHAAQWTHAFLSQCADVVLTYAADVRTTLERAGMRCVPYPHNARFVDVSHLDDPRVCRPNLGPGTGTACMVLEPRAGCETYEIDGVRLTSLDGLRTALMDGSGGFVAGTGWTAACAQMTEPPTVLRDPDGGRMRDSMHCVDYYQKHDLAVIVENCDAAGYVSEKVGDALLAGAVPLYWGSNVDADPVSADMFRRGKNIWWIDLRDVVGTSDPEEVCAAHLVGRCIRDYIRDHVDVALMKREVLAVRREYLVARGAKASRDAIDSVYTSSGSGVGLGVCGGGL